MKRKRTIIKLFFHDTVRTSFGKLWKVSEFDNAFFQDLESIGKRKFFKMAMESFGFLFGKILKYPNIDLM